MITPGELLDGWDILQTREAGAAAMSVRQVKTEGEEVARQFLLGIDASKQRHILIPVAREAKVQEDLQSSGIHITAHSLLDAGVKRLYVDISCKKPHLHELFAIIAAEVLNEVIEHPPQPDRTASKVLDRWRELLRSEAPDRPGLETLIGLFGELYHLREFLTHNPQALRCWRGPFGSRHDFVVGTLALEVKASTARYGKVVEIHGIDQLFPPPDSRLYLSVLKLEQVGAGGESVPALAESLIEAGADQSSLYTALARAGLHPASFNSCRDVQFRMLERSVYEVDERFPRIVPDSFVQGTVPAGIRKIYYQIDLSSEPPYPLSTEAVDALIADIAGEVHQ